MVFEVPDMHSGDTQSGVCEDTADEPDGGISHQRRVAGQKTFPGSGRAEEHPDNKISGVQQDAGELESEGAESDPGGRAKDQDEGQV